MSIKATSQQPTHSAAHHANKAPEWMHGLEKLIHRDAQTLNKFELVGPNSSDPASASGKTALAGAPASVRDFMNKQDTALADNDGSAALYKFPLKDVSSKLKGDAWAVRWTSEDGQLNRMWIFDAAGHGVAKGSSETGGALTWKAA